MLGPRELTALQRRRPRRPVFLPRTGRDVVREALTEARIQSERRRRETPPEPIALHPGALMRATATLLVLALAVPISAGTLALLERGAQGAHTALTTVTRAGQAAVTRAASAAAPEALGAPIVEVLPARVRESTLPLSGRLPVPGPLPEGARLEVVHNGIPAQPLTVGADGRFSSDIALRPGENSLAVVAVREGVRAESAAQVVVLDRTPPELTVREPRYGDVIEKAPVRVTGVAERDAAVTVNGSVAAPRPDGTFSFDVPGSDAGGLLDIIVVARDQAGNVSEVRLPVYLRPQASPAP